RVLRAMGDSLRRVAETEAHFWRTEIQAPLFGTTRTAEEITATIEGHSRALGQTTPDATLALYHGQQSNAWLRNILEALEITLARAGIRTTVTNPPAICFLDLTGYTRLTDERGDVAAADLAVRLSRLVQ